MSVDIVLCTGHDLHPGNEGAEGQGVAEAWFWRAWAPSMARAVRGTGLTCRVRHRHEEVKPWGARQLDLVDRLNKLGPRLIIDLHFNAYNGTTAGVTCIHHPSSTKGEQAAGALIAAVSKAQGTKALPAQARTESWSETELTILTRTDAPAVILEPFFGDVVSDYQAALKALRSGAMQKALALELAELMIEWA